MIPPIVILARPGLRKLKQRKDKADAEATAHEMEKTAEKKAEHETDQD